MARPAESSFYELLEVSSNATTEEIEASYQRLVGVMAPESLAMYAMLDEDESSRIRSQVDEAYRTLTDPDRRAAYDKDHSAGGRGTYPSVMVPEADDRSNLSVGRVRNDAPRDVYSAPAVAPDASGGSSWNAPSAAAPAAPVSAPMSAFSSPDAAEPQAAAPSARPKARAPTPAPSPSRRGRLLQPNLGIEVTSDTECSGSLLRRLRESADAKLEDVAEITKISKRYLHALEENDFDTLPAAVYVRGFVCEYARALGLDPKLVSKSYMTLYKRYRGEGS